MPLIILVYLTGQNQHWFILCLEHVPFIKIFIHIQNIGTDVCNFKNIFILSVFKNVFFNKGYPLLT